MIQRRHGAGFALETLAELFAGNLDGNDPVEPRVARLIYFAHAACAEWRQDLVRPQTCG